MILDIFKFLFPKFYLGITQNPFGVAPPSPGPKPARLREVENAITDILLRRSQGEDVGFDPRRRELLLRQGDIARDRAFEQARADAINQLSGAGLSRNLAARDAILGRLGRDTELNRELARNQIDIEDLTAAHQERDINTGRLQGLNATNFQSALQRAANAANIFGTQIGGLANERKLELAQQEQDAARKGPGFFGALGQLAGLGLGAFTGGAGSAIAGSLFGGRNTSSGRRLGGD